jgi:hypothetical protein
VTRKFLGIFPLKKIGTLELAKMRVKRIDYDGRELLMIQYDNKHWFSADKLNLRPLSDTWETTLGKYKIINPDPYGSPDEILLAKKDGVMELSFKNPLWYSGKGKIYLKPISETQAVTTGIGRNSGETIRMVQIAGGTGILFWGYRMKKIDS